MREGGSAQGALFSCVWVWSGWCVCVRERTQSWASAASSWPPSFWFPWRRQPTGQRLPGRGLLARQGSPEGRDSAGLWVGAWLPSWASSSPPLFDSSPLPSVSPAALLFSRPPLSPSPLPASSLSLPVPLSALSPYRVMDLWHGVKITNSAQR